MANADFNIPMNVKAKRKLLKHFVNVGTSEAPVWELLGKGVENSAIELNPETEDTTDILGTTEVSVTGWKPSQSFDPFTVRGGSKLAFKLHGIWMDNTPELLSQFEMLTVYSYVGDTTDGYDADIQKNCTINIKSIGGDAYVDMPIEVNYSNDKKRGTVKFADGVPTFNEKTAA